MKQSEKDLLRHPPQKVVLMYDAVNDMINEGSDIGTMKVADITSRAGIGKGTAYEYFSTKEEIIMRALQYQMMSYLQSVSEIAYSTGSFEQKAYKMLNFGIEHFNEGRTFFQILKILVGGFDISESLKMEFHRIQEEDICNQFSELQNVIMKAGVEEGILKMTDKNYQRIVFNSQMIAFTMCLHECSKKENSESDLEDIKKYIYDSFVKLLS